MNKKTRHWKKLIAGIEKKYDIVDEIDIIDIQINSMRILKFFEKYVDYVFKPKERLIITHIDASFYIKDTPYSISLYNLYVIIHHLGLPTEHLLILTNQEIEEEISLLSKNFDLTPIQIIKSYYNTILSLEELPNPIDISVDKIEYSYCCINGTQRSGRVLMLCELEDRALLDKGITSWNFTFNDHEINLEIEYGEPIEYLPLLCSRSFVNDCLYLNAQGRKIFSLHSNKFLNNKKVHTLITGEPNDTATRWQPSFLQHALAYVVTETMVNYPHPFLTEKTFKGFLTKRPMLIYSAPGTLAYLKQLGFKTWSNFWDESYDNIQDDYNRLHAIASIIEGLSKLTTHELQDICYKMQDVLEYNYDWYVHGFSKSELEKKIEEVNCLK